MMTVLDKVILLLVSILMFDFKQVDYIMVCLFLAVICMECAIMYFESRRAVTIITGICSLLMIYEPSFASFVPLLIYECIRVRQYISLPVFVFMGVISYLGGMEYNLLSKEMGALLVTMLAGLCMGYRSYREKSLKNKIRDMRDEGSYLAISNRQNREALIRQQDSDIHAATLAERNRIAREIHDHVGHMLSRSILQLGAILSINKDEKLEAPLRGLKDTLDTAMNNIRESVHDLKDESVDLEYMITDIIKQYERLDISLDYDMSKYTPKELKYCLMAIIKEALTNTVKHSDSTKVSIVMREHPALYQVLIEDNGSNDTIVTDKKATTLKADASDKSGIGLENMRERISAFGGNIRFTHEKGFKIFITIPKEMERS